MAIQKIPLNGGVVTARDGTLLAENELQQADDCVLKPFTPAVYRAPGRTAYGTVSGGNPVKALAHLAFDDSSDVLLAWATTSIFSSPFTALTGTFSSLITGLNATTDDQMDVMNYSNAQYLMLGAQNKPRRVAYLPNSVIAGSTNPPSLSARTMGMQPVDPSQSDTLTTPFSVATIAGTWPTALGTGAYWFIITEVFDPGMADEIEGSFVAYDKDKRFLAKSVTISDVTTQGVRVTRHSPFQNDGSNGTNNATAWRVYMSSRNPDTTIPPALTDFTLIATVGGTSGTAPASVDLMSAASVNTTGYGPTGTVGFVGAQATFAGAQAFTNAANIIGRSNNTYADATDDRAAVICKNFGLNAAIVGTIVGIEVLIKMAWQQNNGSPPAGAWVSLSKNNGVVEATNRREAIMQLVRAGAVTLPFTAGTIKVGTPSDTWGATWLNTDLADGNFSVVVGKLGTAGNDDLQIDSVAVKIYTNGQAVDKNGTPFAVIVLEDELGVSASFGANFPPPNATTADVFEGQGIYNDPTKPTTIRYSIPDRPEACPTPYVLSFQSRKRDKVTLIRRVGPILVVGMSNSIKRVNYVPTQADPAFLPGRCFEDVTVRQGIPGPGCAVVFDMGSGPVLAYASKTGMRMTDGQIDRPLNNDQAWSSLVSISNLYLAQLRDDIENQALVLDYVPAGGSTHTKSMQFSYNPIHIKPDGTLPMMGPNNKKARSSASAELSDVPVFLSGHSVNGIVYVENSGTSAIVGETLSPTIRTKLTYLDDVGHKARTNRVYLRVTAAGETVTAVGTTTNGSVTVAGAATFTQIVPGMFVSGIGIQPGTKISAVGSSSSITLSRAANASGTVTLTFKTGAVEATIRAQNVNEAVADRSTLIADCSTGGLVRLNLEAQAEAHEIKVAQTISPVVSPQVDPNMVLHYMAYDAVSHGRETGNR
jgi:hypothetical protein